VSKFLDEIWQKPLLNLSNINSLLYEGIPALTLTRNLRDRAASLLETMVDINVSRALDVSASTLGSRLHFVVSNEFFSLDDLVGISTGEIQQILKLYTKRLVEISPNSINGVDLDDSYIIENGIVASVGKFFQNLSDSFL
jgi:Putative zinc-RING and/or ribbon